MTKIQDVNTVSTTLWGRSAVTCDRFRSTCMPQHSQRLEWKNTDCHRKLEPYLAIIFRHCIRRDPNNQIRLWSPIYSSAMLIKWLQYWHESSSYPAQKEVPLFTSAHHILTRYSGAEYRKYIRNYNARWRENRCSKVALIINTHVFMNWMPDCNIKSLSFFCPIHGWRRRPHGTGSTSVKTVHDQLYVSLGMDSPLQLPFFVDRMAKSDADADGNRKINKSLSMFWPAGDFLLTASQDNCCRLRGWRRNFVKCVIFPLFRQACVVVYLTIEMRSDYANCVEVGKKPLPEPMLTCCYL